MIICFFFVLVIMKSEQRKNTREIVNYSDFLKLKRLDEPKADSCVKYLLFHKISYINDKSLLRWLLNSKIVYKYHISQTQQRRSVSNCDERDSRLKYH